MAKLLSAISAGQGGIENPVHVIIKERESHATNMFPETPTQTFKIPGPQVKVHGSLALRAFWSLPA
jgi:hypothetical protein